VGLSVRLPRQSVWPIFPGVRSFLNCREDQTGIGDRIEGTDFGRYV
jgi:hypothetical protein